MKRHAREKRHASERWKRRWRRVEKAAADTKARIRAWFLPTVFVVVLAALGVLLFSPYLQVREIRISRSDSRLDIAQMQRKLVPLFKRHILLVSALEVEALLKEVVPDMQGLRINKNYPSELAISVTLRPLRVKLAFEEQKTQTPRPQAGTGAVVVNLPKYEYLTDNGLYVSMTQDPKLEKPLTVINIADYAERPAPHTELIAPQTLDTMQQAEEILTKEYGLKIKSRTYFVRSQEFHFQTEKFALWFDLRSPLPVQLARYRTFLESVGLGEVKQYIDVRLTGKVVYR
jgi:hypothetical protein